MRHTDVFDLIRNGEDSGVEFKRDDVAPQSIAKELVAFLNLEGGTLLLGVEDDGSISGVTRPNLEEWISDLCRAKIEPPVIPYMSWAREIEPDKNVLVVRVPAGPNKPYARVHNARRTYFIRVGSTSREASREELERMFQASGRLQYGLKPVPGASFKDLDIRRLRDYFERVLEGDAPPEDDTDAWEDLLCNVELMTRDDDEAIPTIDGMLLFGRTPKRFLPQSGIRATAYPGTEPDYATRADQDLKGALVPLGSRDGHILESGLVEQALDFVRRNTQPTAAISDGKRVERAAYPEDVLREVVVNALVHRDYSIGGTEISLRVFDDRLEVESPGRLPNTVTVEGMRAGLRYARNQILVNVMRDYRYMESRGMGVRYKVIPGMKAHNGTEPEFFADEARFTVRLWR